jgi:hypothetical protein
MKVLHITGSDFSESASRSARALHEALLQAGIDSRVFVASPASTAGGRSSATPVPARDPGVAVAPPPDSQAAAGTGSDDFSTREAGLLQSFCFDENEAGPTASSFCLGYPGMALAEAIGECDLIHFHQVAGGVSPAELRKLSSLGKPVVWSLPDAWAFTGGCFSPGRCGQYQEGCAQCPQLREDAFHLPSRLMADKVAQFRGQSALCLVAPSAFLADALQKSPAFIGSRKVLIPPVVGGLCEAAERELAKGGQSRAGLRIGFVCESPGARVRSARLLGELLEVTQTYGAFRKLVLSGKVTLVVFGLGTVAPAQLTDLPVEFAEGVPAGQADLLVLAKPDENRVAAIVEAKAQGAPVLAFDQGGIGELIQHRQNGWLVKQPELRPLAEALCYLAANPDLVRSLRLPGRNANSNQESLGKFIALYRELVSSAASDASSSLAGGDGSLKGAPVVAEVFSRAASQRPPTGADFRMGPDFRDIVCSIAQTAVSQRSIEDKLARLESAEKQAVGAGQLLAEAQANLENLERRQKRLIETGKLSPEAAKELGKIQKSAASLRNKLKWRGRRLRVYNAPDRFKPAVFFAGHPQLPPPIPGWARTLHRLFLRNHWMKHGKKDQYPPRPMAGERFPAAKLRDEQLPKIAIVTPSFMQGDYLEATLRSILDQNYPNLAYAVHDGGSSDSSLEVIGRHADRITLWASEPDSGQARAIVSGFEKVSGDIMAWVNSDDMLVPGCLRYIGEYFATHPEVDAIYGYRIIVNEHGQEIARWVLPPHQPAITPYLDPVPQETLFWRKSLWEKVGGLDPSFRFALDWDLVLRFQKAGANIVRLPYFLGCFRVHSQQKLSARAESIGAEEIAYLRRRETGGVVSVEQLAPYKEWMEMWSAIYSRLLELGVRK